MANRTVTFKGVNLALTGPEMKVGDSDPGATLRRDLATDVQLREYSDRPRVYSVVPSLDTSVCALQTKRFYEEAGHFPGIRFITISCDLPIAQARFCGAENIGLDRVAVLSDYKDTDFGLKYGTLIPEWRVLCRAVFLIDQHDKFAYVEYVPEMTEHPNYDAVLSAIQNL